MSHHKTILSTICAAFFAMLFSFQLPIHDVYIVLQEVDSASNISPVSNQSFVFLTNHNSDTYNLKTDDTGKSQAIFLGRGTYRESKVLVDGYNVSTRRKIKVKGASNLEVFILTKQQQY